MSLLRPCPECHGEGTMTKSCDEADYGSGCRCYAPRGEDRPHPQVDDCDADGCVEGQVILACDECGEDAAVIFMGEPPLCSPCFLVECDSLPCSSVEERLPLEQDVVGSTPATAAISEQVSPGPGSPVEGQS